MYEKLIIDADTFLLRAAKSVQNDYILVTNKFTGYKKKFKNRTEFYGHWSKKNGGWLNDINRFFGSTFDADSFDVEDCAELSSNLNNHLEEAERLFDITIGRLKQLNLAKDYLIVLGGDSNFRFEAAKLQPYKGHRKEKPLLLNELKDVVVRKYKSKVKVCNGIEADDFCSIMGWENYLHSLKQGDFKYVLAYIDKDLDMIVGPHINPDKPLKSPTLTTPLMAARSFAQQLLTGDKTDNIAGLPAITEEMSEKYGIKAYKGVGCATANALLEGRSAKEMFQVVSDCWRSYYGEDKKEVKSHTGETMKWNWLDYLQDSARLLYLLRKPGELYHITNTFYKLGVEYE